MEVSRGGGCAGGCCSGGGELQAVTPDWLVCRQMVTETEAARSRGSPRRWKNPSVKVDVQADGGFEWKKRRRKKRPTEGEVNRREEGKVWENVWLLVTVRMQMRMGRAVA